MAKIQTFLKKIFLSNFDSQIFVYFKNAWNHNLIYITKNLKNWGILSWSIKITLNSLKLSVKNISFCFSRIFFFRNNLRKFYTQKFSFSTCLSRDTADNFYGIWACAMEKLWIWFILGRVYWFRQLSNVFLGFSEIYGRFR